MSKKGLVVFIGILVALLLVAAIFWGNSAASLKDEPNPVSVVTVPVVPDPPKVADVPVKEESMVVASGPQPGDPVRLVPHDMWQYAEAVGKGSVCFRLPTATKVPIYAPFDSTLEQFLVPRVELESGGKRDISDYEVSPPDSLPKVGISVYLPEKVAHRAIGNVSAGDFLTYVTTSQRIIFLDKKCDILITIFFPVDPAPSVPDNVNKEKDPYRRFEKVIKWVEEENKK